MIGLQPDRIRRHAKELLDSYRIVRRYKMPFPWESVFVWCFLFGLQREMGVRGDLLELGVARGGTALLSLQSRLDGERQVLVDLQRSEQFDEGLALLPEACRQRLEFHECLSSDPSLTGLCEQRFRWIHIDAGHRRQDVLADLERFAPCLQGDGLLVLDDVFEIRWPGVTEAVMNYFGAQSEMFRPVLLANRKFYFARAAAEADYLDALQSAVDSCLQEFGMLRRWQEPFLDGRPMIVKLDAEQALLDGLPA